MNIVPPYFPQHFPQHFLQMTCNTEGWWGLSEIKDDNIKFVILAGGGGGYLKLKMII